MAKNKDKEPKPAFDVNLVVPSFRVLENVQILERNSKRIQVGYRRKSSGYRDIQWFDNERVVACLNESDSNGVLIIIEPQMPLADVGRAYKLNGSVEEDEADFFVDVTNAEGVKSFINPKFAIIKRADDEANKDVPRRGRKKKTETVETAAPSASTTDRLRKKKLRKDKDREGKRDKRDKPSRQREEW